MPIIRQGLWSLKYSSCIKCGTTKTKHKGRGLCLNCFDKKRAENPLRKIQLKNQHDKWYKKVKGTEEHKEYCRKHVKEWQTKINPIAHRRNWQKRNIKLSFKKFILSTARNKTKKGLTICINGEQVKTNILPLKNGNEETNIILYQIEMFKKVLVNINK